SRAISCTIISFLFFNDTATTAIYTLSLHDALPIYLSEVADQSNPYFTYDPSKCIVCSRCVRACDEIQGTFALTVAGKGFESRIRSEEHTSELQSRENLVCRLLLEKKKKKNIHYISH